MSGWLRMLGLGQPEPAARARWAVVDCETSGLDPARDRLLSVGAVMVTAGRISPRDCYEATLAQAAPSGPENILVHGIGAERQRSGRPAREALAGLANFVDGATCVAFHAPFDRAVIARAAREAGVRAPRRWLDLAQLLPVLFPQKALAEAPLGSWLAAFGVHHGSRHDALGDAYATAQLLQIALAEGERQGFGSVGGLLRAVHAARWARS